VNEISANSIKAHVEVLVKCQGRCAPPYETKEWLDSISIENEGLFCDLMRAGLTPMPAAIYNATVDEINAINNVYRQAKETRDQFDQYQQEDFHPVALNGLPVIEVTRHWEVPTQLRRQSLVYFLTHESAVVYVGKSRDGIGRPFFHVGRIIFSRVFVIPCPRLCLDLTERYHINRFLPEYNNDATTKLQKKLREFE
jgi:hypothetical protein